MSSNSSQKLGQQLRHLRQKRRLSQEAFADLIGLDRTYVSGIERGVRNPTLASLEKFSAGLKISLSELLKGI